MTEHLAGLRSAEVERGQAVVEQQQALFVEMASKLNALHDAEDARGQAAVERLAGLESAMTDHLQQLGAGLEAPVHRVLEAAAEGPEAAAALIAQLRDQASNTLERDNALLEERREVLSQLASLAGSLEDTSSTQRQAVIDLVGSSQELLRDMGESLGDRVENEVAKVSDVAAGVAVSAAEVASFGEAVGAAVEQFAMTGDKLMENLTMIEQGMAGNSARSDEQMSYYVAQAREIIDHSMLSQREIIEELRRLGTSDMFAAEAG